MRAKLTHSDKNTAIASRNLEFASTPNSELIEKKHRQIVEGACKVFFKKGFHPTTTRDIAKECGMSIGQLYHYISSKDDVLYLVHKHSQQIWHQYLQHSGDEQENDPKKKFKQSLYNSLLFMAEHRKLIQFIYSETKYLERKHLFQVLKMDQDNVVGYWKRMIKELNKTEEIKGDADFNSSVIAYLLAFVALRGWTLETKPNDQHIDGLVDFIMRALGLE